jgi:sulfatase modifying factor 1
MSTLKYVWQSGRLDHELLLLPVPGTSGKPYLFGPEKKTPVEIRDFYMSTTPVTQAFWTHVMDSNPSLHPGERLPVENVSWDQITGAGGFLERLNSSEIRRALRTSGKSQRFRLPSETEWEYAASGGPHWPDGFRFSGSNDVDQVAWYGPRFSRARRLVCRLLGWRIGWRLMGHFSRRKPTQTHDVATKAPNQLGVYDMCGNVWEWCEDTCTNDLGAIPRDGTPWKGPGSERRLRGGCHHNWDIHCTVRFRYGIARDAHDGCIGFRLVLAPWETTGR